MDPEKSSITILQNPCVNDFVSVLNCHTITLERQIKKAERERLDRLRREIEEAEQKRKEDQRIKDAEMNQRIKEEERVRRISAMKEKQAEKKRVDAKSDTTIPEGILPRLRTAKVIKQEMNLVLTHRSKCHHSRETMDFAISMGVYFCFRFFFSYSFLYRPSSFNFNAWPQQCSYRADADMEQGHAG